MQAIRDVNAELAEDEAEAAGQVPIAPDVDPVAALEAKADRVKTLENRVATLEFTIRAARGDIAVILARIADGWDDYWITRWLTELAADLARQVEG
jgi:hypothetical protein